MNIVTANHGVLWCRFPPTTNGIMQRMPFVHLCVYLLDCKRNYWNGCEQIWTKFSRSTGWSQGQTGKITGTVCPRMDYAGQIFTPIFTSAWLVTSSDQILRGNCKMGGGRKVFKGPPRTNPRNGVPEGQFFESPYICHAWPAATNFCVVTHPGAGKVSEGLPHPRVCAQGTNSLLLPAYAIWHRPIATTAILIHRGERMISTGRVPCPIQPLSEECAFRMFF